jgi:molybdenum cofactor biosynthesis protein B
MLRPMSVQSSDSAHRAHGATQVGCGIITVSDTRTPDTDTSGRTIRTLLETQGHRIELYRILKDEPDQITAAIHAAPASVEVLILNGGTGLAHRDTTYEAIARVLEKEITGFGELFRMLSYEQIGASAMLSRATAGVAGRRVIFSLPGSTAAVELAMTKLILPELAHVVGLVRG